MVTLNDVKFPIIPRGTATGHSPPAIILLLSLSRMLPVFILPVTTSNDVSTTDTALEIAKYFAGLERLL